MNPEENNREKTPREAIAFLPDALEIRNSRLPLAVRLCVWIPFLVLVAAIVWASVCSVDVIVQARGKVVTDRPTIVLKPYERIVIKDIPVKVGDIVEEGQELIIFDPAIYRADAERLKNEVDTRQAQYDRLRAEFDGTEYTVKNPGSTFETNQRAIFEQRREYYREKINYFDEAIRQYDASRKTREDSLRNYEARLKVIYDLEKMYKNLEKGRAATWKELAEFSVTRMEMENNADNVRNSIQELSHQRAGTVSNKQSFIQEWRNSISEDMVSAQNKLITAQKEYTQAEQLINYTAIYSPCRAVVHEIASYSKNSAVREAEALITLIPIDGTLEIEAEVRPMDIGKITKKTAEKPGSSARIKLDAYPFQKHGTLDGEVIDISENTLQKERKTLDPEESTTYYRTRLSYSGHLEKVPDNFRLIPGMEVQVEIKTGRRRIITYVTYPLIKSLTETAREP